MSSESITGSKSNRAGLFEDDLDNLHYPEPEDDKTERIDDYEEVKYWLENPDSKPGLIDEFLADVRNIFFMVTRPITKRVTWAGRNFLKLGYSKYTLVYFLIFVFITIYFGTILHESLHIVAAAFVGDVPMGIRLNTDLYAQVGSALSIATGGFVQTTALDPNNPGVALIWNSGNPLHTAIIGIFPNVVLFMIGFTWLRKGLNETRAGFFAAGLVFSCSNLEIFITSMYTDITPTVNYIANILNITGNNVGAITFLLAASVLGSGYLLSVLYDKWQKGLQERHRLLYPFDKKCMLVSA